MKKVLITGANSYVGTHVEEWLMKEPDEFYVKTLDMKDPNWKNFDFSKFDVVFHVAGIAHVSAKKKMKDLYFKVNRDLAIETAQKAKAFGVKQFIFMSSMIVYSCKETRIRKETKPNPDNFYGESKLQAEQGIQKLQDESFKVCILRPPMIYGPNSQGNFSKLLKFTKTTVLFPSFDNHRSVLFIYNLSNVIEKIIIRENSGIIFPRNNELVSTSTLIQIMASIQKRKILFVKIFNPLIKLFKNKINILNKTFTDFYYDKLIDEKSLKLNIFNLRESLAITIEKSKKRVGNQVE